MFLRKKTKPKPNRRAEIDGVIKLINCPNCNKKVEETYFKCVRCGIETCYSCGETTDIPYHCATWCKSGKDCYNWIKEKIREPIKKYQEEMKK